MHRLFSATRLLSILLLALLSAACGGLDPDLPMSRGPFLLLHEYLDGPKTGYLTAIDRNGNVREAGIVRRSCYPADDDSLSGGCDEIIEYQYSNRVDICSFEYRVHYPEDGHAEARLDYAQCRYQQRDPANPGAPPQELGVDESPGSFRGFTRGTLVALQGTFRIPGSDEHAGVRLWMSAQHGPNNPVVQTMEYSAFFGLVDLGRVQILWLDGNL